MIDPNQRFYVSVMGQERGPYGTMELREMMARGEIRQGETMARST